MLRNVSIKIQLLSNNSYWTISHFWQCQVTALQRIHQFKEACLWKQFNKSIWSIAEQLSDERDDGGGGGGGGVALNNHSIKTFVNTRRMESPWKWFTDRGRDFKWEYRVGWRISELTVQKRNQWNWISLHPVVITAGCMKRRCNTGFVVGYLRQFSVVSTRTSLEDGIHLMFHPWLAPWLRSRSSEPFQLTGRSI